MNATMIQDILAALLTQLKLPFEKVNVSDGEGFQRVDIVSPSPSKLIGWHGETLNSLQHLLKVIVRAKEGGEGSPFIVLDVDGYRRDQEDKVRQAAERKADFVRRTGSRIALPPMSPYFRRVVHMHVANTPSLQDLTTVSTGEGDYRQVVLRLKDEKGKQSAQEGEELSPVLAVQEGEDDLGNLDV